MTLGLPKPEGDPTSLPEEIRDVLNEIRGYRNQELGEDIEKIIHDVAMDPEVSGRVISKIKSELPACRRRYFGISVRFWLIWPAPIPIIFLGHVLSNNHSFAHAVLVGSGTMMVANIVIFYVLYGEWRADYRDAYIANFLVRTLEFGLMYQDELTDERLRDGFATMIQRSAIRYSIVYKRSDSTRFFASQVRRQARSCRNDIMSLVPGLVTADQAKIRTTSEDLARLLIRTQTGYWYQTSDIAKHGMPMPRRNAIRISLASFFRDRSIQAAFLAPAAGVVVAVIALATHT